MYGGDSDPKTRKEKKGGKQGKKIYNQKTIRIKTELMENRSRKEGNKGNKS